MRLGHQSNRQEAAWVKNKGNMEPNLAPLSDPTEIDQFFLISSGVVHEQQPITFMEGVKGTPPTVLYPWSGSKPAGDDERKLKKVVVDLGAYSALDFCGALPTLMNYPYF